MIRPDRFAARSLLVAALGALPSAAQSPQPGAVEHSPRVDPARELRGHALVEALRRGGFVLFLRHAEQGDMPQSPDCAVPQLTPEGVAQARRVGDALRRAAIPVGAVRSSPLCRALQTATGLALGAPIVTASLAPSADAATVAERQRLLAEPPKAGANTILVSHVHVSTTGEARIVTDKAGFVVFLPDGRGRAEPVAHLPVGAWDAMLADAASR